MDELELLHADALTEAGKRGENFTARNTHNRKTADCAMLCSQCLGLLAGTRNKTTHKRQGGGRMLQGRELRGD